MRKLLFLLIVSTALISCATQPHVKTMRYTTDSFEPTNKVEVIQTKPVGRDYVEIGEVSIRLKRSTEENAVAYLVEKAKDLGADAIIIIGERSRGAVAIPAGNMAVAVPIKELYAVAIKYK